MRMNLHVKCAVLTKIKCPQILIKFPCVKCIKHCENSLSSPRIIVLQADRHGETLSWRHQKLRVWDSHSSSAFWDTTLRQKCFSLCIFASRGPLQKRTYCISKGIGLPVRYVCWFSCNFIYTSVEYKQSTLCTCTSLPIAVRFGKVSEDKQDTVLHIVT
jgi:hypothetical protein